MFCPKCGIENADATKFCVKCGTSMVASVPEAAPPEPPAPSSVPAALSPTVSRQRPGKTGVVVGWILAAIGVLGIIGLPPTALGPGGGLRLMSGMVLAVGFVAGGILLVRGRGRAGAIVILVSLLASLAIPVILSSV